MSGPEEGDRKGSQAVAVSELEELRKQDAARESSPAKTVGVEGAKRSQKPPSKKGETQVVVESTIDPVPTDVEPVETYWIEEPFAKIVVMPIPGRGGQLGYFIDEVQLDEKERATFRKLRDILSKELSPPKDMTVDARSYVTSEAMRLMKKYRYIMGSPSDELLRKIEYYVRKDLIGYGPINSIVEDKNIEDISADGIDKPVYVWHRKYESLPSNLRFMDRSYFNDFVIKLAHFAGRHISTAFPIVDAMLPGRHRLAATYGEEVSTFGSTFTIRKFREEPFSIVDLIELGTLDPRLAAYLWFVLDNRLTVMVMGGTGAGKTSFLNALANLFKPGLKIITVEETAELNVPHDNWVQFVSRASYGLGAAKIGEVTLFDLVRTSLRYRPDYLIVGEIRGEEAFVLFQAVATGHGGMSTIHAENLDYAIKRMMSPPMNVAEPYIPLMNVACLIERVALPKKKDGQPFGRRVRQLWEIRPDGVGETIAQWDPIEDKYTVATERSIHLPNICMKLGKPRDSYVEELKVREAVLRWMVDQKISDFHEVAHIVTQFHVKRRQERSE
jgi:flagellar protein FlaI